MTDYQTLIEQCGVHLELGPGGQGWGIEQSPVELATFFAAIPPIQTVLEVGTGHKAGLTRFMYDKLGWNVTTIDIKDYGHTSIPGVTFIVTSERIEFGHGFDLVIIDADHAYTEVLLDYVHYGAYARKALMFHDIAGLRGCEGAHKFWRALAYNDEPEIRAKFHEIIAEGPQRVGIGWMEIE